MPLEREYWESIDVSIEDIIENEKKLDDVRKRLANKLNGLFGDCNALVKDTYGVSGDTLYDSVSSLFSSSIDNFRELYALATYSENKVNSELIYEIASINLKGPLSKQIAEKTINAQSLLLPLFKTNPDSLYDIHYAHILQCNYVRKFQLSSKLAIPVPFKSIDGKKN